MRKTLIVLATATPLLAIGAYAFAAQPAAPAGDDLFTKATTQASVAEKAEPLKAINVKSLKLGDDMDRAEGNERGEHGEMGEGIDD